MRLGLVVLPEASASEACVGLASTLVRERNMRAVVGPGALPHVTLLHVESGEDPDAFWREAEAAIQPSFTLDVVALGLVRYDVPYNAPAAAPATMAWLIIPCTPALRAAEQAALALPFVSRSRVTTGNGDLFQPHVTLAIWDGEIAPSAHTLPSELIGTRITARLALGVIGPNGTYQRTLHSA